MSNNNAPQFEYSASREIEEVFPYYNYTAIQSLTQDIIVELMKSRKHAVKVVVKFYEEETP